MAVAILEDIAHHPWCRVRSKSRQRRAGRAEQASTEQAGIGEQASTEKASTEQAST